jgi:hypothetical protein
MAKAVRITSADENDFRAQQTHEGFRRRAAAAVMGCKHQIYRRQAAANLPLNFDANVTRQ